jgi:beta-lactamase regulating signal transducer with metallopeptidase domain
MSDLCLVLTPVMFAYVSVGLGVAVALLVWTLLRRGNRPLSIEQAEWCAWLPVLALVTLILASFLPAATQEPGNALHQAWHVGVSAMTAMPALHNAIHVLNSVLLVFAAGAVVRSIFLIGRQCALIASLRNLPLEEIQWSGQTIAKLETAQPFCFTMGFFKPRVYVASALLEQLNSRQCDAMFAHEVSHIRRRDGLLGASLTLFYALFPLPGTRTLLREWQHASERACDAGAARHLGDPCGVADALIEVTRIVTHPTISGIACFAATDDVEERVTALLALGGREKRPVTYKAGLFSAAIVLSIAGFVAAETWVHHLIELFVHH